MGVILGALLLTASPAWSQTNFDWSQTTAGTYDWFIAGNWTNNAAPTNGNSRARFGTVAGYALQAGRFDITNGFDLTIAALQFGNISNQTSVTNYFSGAGVIILNNTSTATAQATIQRVSGGLNPIISNNIVLADTNGVTFDMYGNIRLDGVASGTNTLNVSGGGARVYLGGASTFSGNVVISNGWVVGLSTKSFSGASSGTYTFAGSGTGTDVGLGDLATNGVATFANAIALGTNARSIRFGSGGSNSIFEITTSSISDPGTSTNATVMIVRAQGDTALGVSSPADVGTVKFSGTNFTINRNVIGTTNESKWELAPASGKQTWNGNVTTFSNNSTVIKSGAGTVAFAGSNTYTAQSFVSGGVLEINGTHVDASSTTNNGYGSATNGHFLVQDGATISGTGRIAGSTAANNSNLLLAQSNATVAPGSGGIGTFTLDGGNISGTNSRVLNMAAGSKFLFDLGPGGTSDKISLWNYVSGDVALNNNTIDLNLTGTQIDGRYTVSLFGFYSDSGTNAASSGITSGLTIGTKGAIIGTPTLNYNSGGSTIDLSYNVGAMFYTNGTACTGTAAESYDARTYIRNGTILNANATGVLPTDTPTALIMDDTGSGGSVLNLGANQTVASLSGAATSTIGLGTKTLTVDGANSSSFAGAISGAGGSLVKSGTGTLTLSGSNTFTGATTVEAGKLVVNGAISGSAVTVTNSGALGGSGSVGALIIADGGTLAPGNSPGTLFAASATWADRGSYDWEILDAAGTAGATNGWDLLDVAGTLTLTGLTNSAFTINLITLSDTTMPGPMANFNSSSNYSWMIARAAAISGYSASLFNLYTGSFSNAYTGTFAITNGLFEGDEALFLTYTAGGAAVPEPGTWAAAALLAAAAGFINRRRRTTKG